LCDTAWGDGKVRVACIQVSAFNDLRGFLDLFETNGGLASPISFSRPIVIGILGNLGKIDWMALCFRE
jgi:hypothetical protein